VHTLSVLGIDRRSAGPLSPLRDLLDAVGIAASVGLIGLVIERADGPARILLALAFAFFVPGRAIVSNWPRFAYWSEFGMSIVLSLAVLTLLATVTLWAHEWHPVGMFEIEASLSALALVGSMIRRHRGTEATHQDPDPTTADAEVGPVRARYRGGAQPSPEGDAW
jgi:uncharacterized membrane protein